MKTVLAAGIYLTLALGLQARAETAQGLSTPVAAAERGLSGCSGPNGNIFNLEPRNNAVTQSAMSVAFLPNRVAPNIDLVVATAADGRGASTNPNQTLAAADAYYGQRSNSNCAPDFEGGLPAINNVFDLFLPFGSPTVVADPARDAFFIVDLRFGRTHDNNGVGVVRATAANLLNPASCPNGTELKSATCWNTGAVVNITTLNAFLSSPHMAVDPRTSGTGAGDLYLTVTEQNPNGSNTHISLTACTNATFNCSGAINLTGADVHADLSWVEVRPDGSITISYRNTTFPGINAEDIKFINCTPRGAPATPICSSPVLVMHETQPIFVASPGNVAISDVLYPKHAHRPESGNAVTTFLVYDRCEVPERVPGGASGNFCPKTDVVMTFSTDGGRSWSPISKASNGAGQQFFGAIALDASTRTINIAYYSTENDPYAQRLQVFLAPILRNQTWVSSTQLLTTGVADPQSVSPFVVGSPVTGFGDRIGVAAGGTGSGGHSHVYTTFSWNSVPGIYDGVTNPDINNHLTRFDY
ncbi:MAG TPA: hypothetical protein VN982_09065 [Candidatus Dormibacteraeota bacterium]|nr:hypothetical protein [Candidatus Dormibacteraeota bacterium]